MTRDHRADLALRGLAELPVAEFGSQGDARQRRQVIDRLEQLQREGPRAMPRQRVWRLSMAALALGALAALALVLATRSWGSADHASPATPGAQVSPTARASERTVTTGSEVKTDAGSTVQLKTALGAKISVAGSSELRLAASEASGAIERVDLARGSIRVKVPKLGAQRQFRVSTPDTLVIVHGTEFSVSVRKDAAGRPQTAVEVLSGRVEVRRKQAVEFLGAGAAWSSETSAAAGAASASTPVAAGGVPPPSAVPPRGLVPAAAPRGNLAQANALLSGALEASRQGNDTLALTRLDELLRRYPDSPVADNARVERFRTLRRLGRDRDAARAASKYLKGDPDGFARDEARELDK